MISVLIPVFEPDARLLAEAVRSVLDSPVHDLEVLIIEDAGTSSLPRFTDARVRHIINDRRDRLGAALNRGLAEASGSLIARMDADDICERERFPAQLAMFQADPQLAVAGSQLTIIDENGARIGSRRYPTAHAAIAETLTRYNCLAHSSVMFRKSAVEHVGGYTAGILAEDYDLWCRLLVSGASFANHPEALVRYRHHAAALKQRTVKPALRATIAIKNRYFGSRLSPRARARIAAERALLLMPSPLVLSLFERVAYRRS